MDREKLWDRLMESISDIEELKTIIQNPVPLTRDDLTVWGFNRMTKSRKLAKVLDDIYQYSEEQINDKDI